MKPCHEQMRSLLKEAITGLCRKGLQYRDSFTVDGLLGITLDEGEVFLVNIHEGVGVDVQESHNKRKRVCGHIVKQNTDTENVDGCSTAQQAPMTLTRSINSDGQEKEQILVETVKHNDSFPFILDVCGAYQDNDTGGVGLDPQTGGESMKVLSGLSWQVVKEDGNSSIICRSDESNRLHAISEQGHTNRSLVLFERGDLNRSIALSEQGDLNISLALPEQGDLRRSLIALPERRDVDQDDEHESRIDVTINKEGTDESWTITGLFPERKMSNGVESNHTEEVSKSENSYVQNAKGENSYKSKITSGEIWIVEKDDSCSSEHSTENAYVCQQKEQSSQDPELSVHYNTGPQEGLEIQITREEYNSASEKELEVCHQQGVTRSSNEGAKNAQTILQDTPIISEMAKQNQHTSNKAGTDSREKRKTTKSTRTVGEYIYDVFMKAKLEEPVTLETRGRKKKKVPTATLR